MLSITSASKLHDRYDLVVIGAGPAGLGAVNHPQLADKKVLVVDGGKSVANRDRNSPNDLTCGDGGAGLFSVGFRR